jgi:TPR repeat protein
VASPDAFLDYWAQSAGKGYAPAALHLGLEYLKRGDRNKAESWLTHKQEENYLRQRACEGLGHLCSLSGEFGKAAQYYQTAVEGDCPLPSAQYRLGRLYETGQGVPKDWDKAAYYIKGAADKQDGRAALAYADYRATGWGDERRIQPREAEEYFTKGQALLNRASGGGDREATLLLANSFRAGLQVGDKKIAERNLDEAATLVRAWATPDSGKTPSNEEAILKLADQSNTVQPECAVDDLLREVLCHVALLLKGERVKEVRESLLRAGHEELADLLALDVACEVRKDFVDDNVYLYNSGKQSLV